MPWIGSDLLWHCVELATELRVLDMQAGPYANSLLHAVMADRYWGEDFGDAAATVFTGHARRVAEQHGLSIA